MRIKNIELHSEAHFQEAFVTLVTTYVIFLGEQKQQQKLLWRIDSLQLRLHLAFFAAPTTAPPPVGLDAILRSPNAYRYMYTYTEESFKRHPLLSSSFRFEATFRKSQLPSTGRSVNAEGLLTGQWLQRASAMFLCSRSRIVAF